MAKCAREPRLKGLLGGNAPVMQYLEQKTLVTWQQQITKFSVKDVNLETLTDTQSQYKI